MSGAQITVEIRDQAARQTLRQIAQLGREPGPLLRAIGAGLAENTRDRFDRGVDPAGFAWAPLRDFYAPLKKGPGILREAGMRGGLQGSITFDVAGDAVAVGSNKVYAAIHQFGGVIKAKKAPFLVFRTTAGLAFAKQVTIPARPYLGLSAEDEDTILDVAETMLDRWTRSPAGGGART
jgi:phage virion morphogenesis protein